MGLRKKPSTDQHFQRETPDPGNCIRTPHRHPGIKSHQCFPIGNEHQSQHEVSILFPIFLPLRGVGGGAIQIGSQSQRARLFICHVLFLCGQGDCMNPPDPQAWITGCSRIPSQATWWLSWTHTNKRCRGGVAVDFSNAIGIWPKKFRDCRFNFSKLNSTSISYFWIFLSPNVCVSFVAQCVNDICAVFCSDASIYF